MKALKKSLLVATMFATVAGMANGPVKTFGKKVNEVEKNLISIELDPVFVKKGNRMLLNLLNLDQEKVIIRIYDSERRIVFQETIKGEMIIEKSFNFEKAYADNYTIVVVDNDEAFQEVVEVN